MAARLVGILGIAFMIFGTAYMAGGVAFMVRVGVGIALFGGLAWLFGMAVLGQWNPFK